MIGQTFSHYRIIEKLGSGGMGEVYLAEDTSLRRKVAVKFLSPEKQQDETAHHRILREARSAASLEHSNICTIHEVGSVDGKDFIVMEYVDGQTLRDRLVKAPVTAEAALRIVGDVAEALEEAHENGVIHKDLKPANIMITRKGHTKVLDFGLAMKLPSNEAFESGADTLSKSVWGQEGGGTPAYMSPEQLLGESIDARSDIFSLGIVFYEMLARKNPFLAANSVATADRILHEDPKPIRKISPELPPEIAKLVGRMLAKNPDERPASVRELLASVRALTRSEKNVDSTPSWHPEFLKHKRGVALAISGLLLFIILAAILQFARHASRHEPIAKLPAKIYLAVLPFEVIGGTGDDAAFSRGLIETINSQLTKLIAYNSMRVVPASDVIEKNIRTVQEAFQELGVNLVLRGSVRSAGEQLRINYVLADDKSKPGLRGDTITGAASDPFRLEDDVIESVLSNLEISLPDERIFFASRTTRQPNAYNYYLRARGHLQQYQNPESVQSAVDVLQFALDLDPEFAQAYAALGEARWRQYEQTKDMARVEEALADCNKAVGFDDELAGAHVCLGFVYTGTGKYEQAVQEYQRAVELEPTSDAAYRGLASAYENLGWFQDAEETYSRAIKLDPEYWGGYSVLGAYYARQGRYGEAEDQFSHVIKLVPDHYFGYSNLGGIYLYEGRYKEAMEMLQHSVELRPTSEAYSNLGTACFFGRRFSEAAIAYEEATMLSEREWMMWGNLGDARYMDPANRDRADEAYRQALSLGNQEFQVNPRNATLLGYMAYYHAMLNEGEKAQNSAKLAIAIDPQDPELLFNLALTFHQLGEIDQTLDWLKKAMAAGFSRTIIRDTPLLDHLRSAPEFQRLLQEE